MAKGKILIIDDDHQISDVARVRLGVAGFKTVVAHNGARGIEAAAEEGPDVILLDVRMPVMDGITALRELKKNPKTREIPVVILSASLVDRDAALDGGAAYFIRKPFEGKSLVEAVEAAKTPVAAR